MCEDKTIQNCVHFLLKSHEEDVEWGGGFLEKSEVSLIKILIKKSINTWTSKMSFNCWKILEKYKDELESFEISFEDIEKPDYLLVEKKSDNILKIKSNKFYIENPTDNIKKHFKNISFIFSLENIYKLLPFLLSNEISLDKEYFKFINTFFNIIDESKMKNLFTAKDLKNLKKELKPFQAVGVLFLLLNKRSILGDEMGLGKTIQALATVEIANLKPALIVCPKNLKLNWACEINNTLKNNKISILDKNIDSDSDFYIINYESLHNHIDFINNLGIKSIIFDESHYLKNKTTKRVKSCLKIIKNVEYRIALTGTPVLKEPIDLVSQLQIINQFDEFGSEVNFKEDYYDISNNEWGKPTKKYCKNLNKLNQKLKEICFLRREKNMVAKFLPSKTKNTIYLDISNKEYDKFYKLFQSLPKQEKLAKLDKLRQLAALAKLDSLTEWIDNFLNTDKKLVVFAFHQKMQEVLLETYPNAARLTKGMSSEDKQSNIDKFQNTDDCNIIICSIKAFSTGLTLTASSDVLFAELDWCAATNDQCEDRCHRIGQTENVNIWYLIAKNTIEEYILQIVNDKKEIMKTSFFVENSETKQAIDYSSILNELISKIEKNK